ncbi:hypothetical protein QYM36_007663 [Artemia franciscana]|uniref:Annexin n=1 Tax=Artemia franciscana TaxID=6661 RepID=A0AA88IEY9_ARTSF|nr:hypothetical protein QYM36_007663 [Artemia franciscana]
MPFLSPLQTETKGETGFSKGGEKKLGTDEETFVILLGHAGRQQLLAVFEEYKAIFGITLEQAVKSEFSGDLHKAILTISDIFLVCFHLNILFRVTVNITGDQPPSMAYNKV